MTSINMNIAGTWRGILGVYMNISGTWTPISSGYMNIGGTWTQFYSAPATTYTITASAGAGGTISPSGSVVVSSGASQTFTITANSGYVISGVSVDGVAQGAIGSYTFTNVTSNHTISATFVAGTPVYYTITASAGANGSISPSGAVSVLAGASQTFTITANSGYAVDAVTVDGSVSYGTATYTFTNVTSTHTISATFFSPSAGNRCTSLDVIFGFCPTVGCCSLNGGSTVCSPISC